MFAGPPVTNIFLRHDFAEELDHLVMVGFARIAGEACVGHGIACQLLEVAFDQTRARLGNLDVFGKLAHGRDGRVGCFFSAHARGVNAHRAGHIGQAIDDHGFVEFHRDGQKHRAGNAVRRVVVRRKRVRHGVVDAQTYVGEAHTGDVLGERHAFAAACGHAAFRFGHRVAQVLRDELDRL